jgi:hypothetical protein
MAVGAHYKAVCMTAAIWKKMEARIQVTAMHSLACRPHEAIHILCPGMAAATMVGRAGDWPSQANWLTLTGIHDDGWDIRHDEWPLWSRGRSSCRMSQYFIYVPILLLPGNFLMRRNTTASTGHYIFVPEGTVWRYWTEYVTIEDEANNTRLYRSTILHFCSCGYGLTHEGTEQNTVLKQIIRDYTYIQTNNTRIIILSMNESGWSETLCLRKSMHKYANMNIHSWKRIILDTQKFGVAVFG